MDNVRTFTINTWLDIDHEMEQQRAHDTMGTFKYK